MEFDVHEERPSPFLRQDDFVSAGPPPSRGQGFVDPARAAASWARLIAKVYGVDPLVCRRCGGKLRIIAYITDSLSIKQILDHLGLWPAEDEKPPPAPREVRAVPVDQEGREIGEAW